jgi:hypothetical protein
MMLSLCRSYKVVSRRRRRPCDEEIKEILSDLVVGFGELKELRYA